MRSFRAGEQDDSGYVLREFRLREPGLERVDKVVRRGQQPETERDATDDGEPSASALTASGEQQPAQDHDAENNLRRAEH